ncbi:MAG: three-Cys-motif partner protein TcmP [Roseiflexus sp.]|nr:three-Cys-motif partner protein TcmP [Roseiflexus sp.]MBO9340789.1 three-Cys-motif partner protein TcmP [Roseiflexus sp.]MBO9363505.1 three-Cys-motif partner protein TcmP [Roseiflexus sp.]MBO9381782.1 three-Cys-motif partner protein TcmP [Roseiflexus sp.]MBO9387952.1 three-Cys-motif partner protein TcmP [Roseiflexus sp.]
MGAWFPILGSGNRRLVYIDGFCGPGRYEGGEDGSPIIALKEAMNPRERLASHEIIFLFLDERKDRID